MPARKKINQIRICMDFHYLNNAYPKGDLQFMLYRMLYWSLGYEVQEKEKCT